MHRALNDQKDQKELEFFNTNIFRVFWCADGILSTGLHSPGFGSVSPEWN